MSKTNNTEIADLKICVPGSGARIGSGIEWSSVRGGYCYRVDNTPLQKA